MAMMRRLFYFLLILSVLLAGAAAYMLRDGQNKEDESFNKEAFRHAFVIQTANSLLGFDLVDPEQAPQKERVSVMRGYHIFLDTPAYAPDYCHNVLSCTNCHFLGGGKLGGKNGGISLVGVTAEYPQFSKRSGKTISLKERICNCFERSMNGKSPPIDSATMNDLISYLQWISKELEDIKKKGDIKTIPWLGLPEIKSQHIPNAQVGKEIYIQRCAACHRYDGAGGGVVDKLSKKTIPPLCGEYSFNDGAGMNTIKMLSSFVFLNMPYQGADLTEEESLDVAAYIIEQPRPHYIVD